MATTSAGSAVSSSSRWPRTIVSGVRSSCPASSRNSRCGGERLLQPVEHRVELSARSSDTFVAAADLQAATEIAVGDAASGVAEPADRAQQPAGDPRGQPGDEDDRHGGEQRVGDHELAQVLTTGADVVGDDERRGRAALRHGLHRDAILRPPHGDGASAAGRLESLDDLLERGRAQESLVALTLVGGTA